MFESGSVSQRCLVCTGREGVFSESFKAYIPFPISTILYWMYTNIFLSFSILYKNQYWNTKKPQKSKTNKRKKQKNPSKTKKRPKEQKNNQKRKKQTKTIQVYILVLNIIMVNWSNICLVYTSTSISIYSKAQRTHFLYMRFMYHCITWNGIIKMSFIRGR